MQASVKRMGRTVLDLCAVVLISLTPSASQKVGPPDLSGFTPASPEHIINEIARPFRVRAVEGFVFSPRGPEEPMPMVLFEIRGPGAEKKIRRARTNERGRFKIVGVPEGTYRFKATLDGFQSVIGTIIVSKKNSQKHPIRIQMHYGV